MANSNQYQSYDFGFGAGEKNREDLLDIVVNIAPWDTPLFSACPKTTCRHTTHDWIEDTLGTAGVFSEGAAFGASSLLTRSRLSNITMIFRKDIDVSETQRSVNPAGIRDEYAYQVSIAMKEIARGIETRLFASAVSASASGTGTTGRLMKVLEHFITTNTASSTDNGSKALLDSLIEKAFIAGGTPGRVYCHPNTKSKFANALGAPAGVNYRNIAAADARVVGNVDVYVSNFGTIELVPDRFIPTAGATTGYGRYWLLEQPKVRIAFLRPIKHVPLPPAGDSVRGMVLGELTMEVMAETAHAKATNVTAGA